MQFIEQVKEISRLNSDVYMQVQDIKAEIMASAKKGNFSLNIPNPQNSSKVMRFLESEGFLVSVDFGKDKKLQMTIRWNV